MRDQHVPSAASLGVIYARAAAAVCALLGGLVLVGWGLDIPALRSVIPGAVEMKANTAVGLIGASLGLMLATRFPAPGRLGWPHLLLSALVALLGAATLSEYAFGRNLGIDELLVRDTGAAFNQIKGRMSPYSAFAFLVLGVGIASWPRPSLAWVSRAAGVLVVAIGVVSFVGYLWNATELITDRLAPPVAVNTACAFVLLGVALLLPDGAFGSDLARQRRTRIETLVLGGLIPTALFVVVGGGLTYESGASFARATERVAHTQEVRTELGQLRVSIIDAETAQRNLMLTGETSFQPDVTARISDVRSHIRRLAALVADNPAQMQRQQRLAELIDQRLIALAEVSETLRRFGSVPARNALSGYVLKHRPAIVEAAITDMDNAEKELLRARLQQSEDRRQKTLASLLATVVVLLALFMLLFRGIRREMLARGEAEERLQQLNADLERRIGERTAEVSHQQAFLRRVIDLDRNLIFAKDRDGRFVLANQALADALATTVDKLTGETERPFHAATDEVNQFEAADLQVIESGKELSIPQESFTDASGNARWLSTVKRPILSPDGLSTIVLGVSVDITQRIADENEIRQLNVDLERRVQERTLDLNQSNVLLQQARLDSEAASRAKSAFLANMSHEIRTPMNAVIGLTHLMQREATDPVQKERLGKVGDAAQHLLQVINDILDMSKIEAGKMTLENIEFSLDQVLTKATAMVNTQAHGKGLELILDTDHLPNRLIGDPTRFSQILINLLSNAVKFTESGWVRLRGRLLSEQAQRVEVRFDVQDTGPGIALEKQAGLFSAFEQVDTSTSRQHGGTGLGLALSRQLAIAMGGDAGVISSPGSGSTFWFTAWLARGEQAAPRFAPLQTRGLRALLVDDLPEALSVIGDRLRGLGLVVDSLGSGPAALAKVEAEMAAGRPYDVMVIDWHMAPLDGIETLRQLNALLGHGTPPAIMVTAFDDATLSARARAAGYQAVILKPITSSSLQDAMAHVLSKPGSAQEPALPSTDDEAVVRSRHAGQRVLLAEDNPINREVAEELLGSAGLVVETATDGARAVAMALSRHYDLVLMDVQMPIMDGLEAAREIRARSGHRIPIIAMTANAFAEDRGASLDAGMNDHVAKPVDPALLYSTLLRWLPLRTEPQPDELTSDFGQLSQENLRQRLEALTDIDLERALRHVAGNQAVLARVLRRLAATYADGLPALLATEGTEAERRLQWSAICHSVRGALSTVAASQLLAEVTSLEQDLLLTVPLPRLLERGAALHRNLLRLVARVNDELAHL